MPARFKNTVIPLFVFIILVTNLKFEKMKTLRKAQMIIAYAVLIAFVIAALTIMFGYIQRRVQGVYQQAGDSIGGGEQLD